MSRDITSAEDGATTWGSHQVENNRLDMICVVPGNALHLDSDSGARCMQVCTLSPLTQVCNVVFQPIMLTGLRWLVREGEASQKRTLVVVQEPFTAILEQYVSLRHTWSA